MESEEVPCYYNPTRGRSSFDFQEQDRLVNFDRMSDRNCTSSDDFSRTGSTSAAHDESCSCVGAEKEDQEDSMTQCQRSIVASSLSTSSNNEKCCRSHHRTTTRRRRRRHMIVVSFVSVLLIVVANLFWGNNDRGKKNAELQDNYFENQASARIRNEFENPGRSNHNDPVVQIGMSSLIIPPVNLVGAAAKGTTFSSSRRNDHINQKERQVSSSFQRDDNVGVDFDSTTTSATSTTSTTTYSGLPPAGSTSAASMQQQQSSGAQILTKAVVPSLSGTLDASDVVECYAVTRLAKLKMPPLPKLTTPSPTSSPTDTTNSPTSFSATLENDGNHTRRLKDEDSATPAGAGNERLPASTPAAAGTVILVRKSALAFRYRSSGSGGGGSNNNAASSFRSSSNSKPDSFSLTLEYGPQRTGVDMDHEAIPIVEGGEPLLLEDGTIGTSGKFVSWQNEGKVYYETNVGGGDEDDLSNERWETANYMAPITGAVLSKMLDYAVDYTSHFPRYQPFQVYDLQQQKAIFPSSSSDDFVWNMFDRLAGLYVELQPLLKQPRHKLRLYVNTSFNHVEEIPIVSSQSSEQKQGEEEGEGTGGGEYDDNNNQDGDSNDDGGTRHLEQQHHQKRRRQQQQQRRKVQDSRTVTSSTESTISTVPGTTSESVEEYDDSSSTTTAATTTTDIYNGRDDDEIDLIPADEEGMSTETAKETAPSEVIRIHHKVAQVVEAYTNNQAASEFLEEFYRCGYSILSGQYSVLEDLYDNEEEKSAVEEEDSEELENDQEEYINELNEDEHEGEEDDSLKEQQPQALVPTEEGIAAEKEDVLDSTETTALPEHYYDKEEDDTPSSSNNVTSSHLGQFKYQTNASKATEIVTVHNDTLDYNENEDNVTLGNASTPSGDSSSTINETTKHHTTTIKKKKKHTSTTSGSTNTTEGGTNTKTTEATTTNNESTKTPTEEGGDDRRWNRRSHQRSLVSSQSSVVVRYSSSSLPPKDALLSGNGQLMTEILAPCFASKRFMQQQRLEIQLPPLQQKASSTNEEAMSFSNATTTTSSTSSNNPSSDKANDHNSDATTGSSQENDATAATNTIFTISAYLFLDGANYYRVNLTYPYMQSVTLDEPLPLPKLLSEGTGDVLDWTLAMMIMGGFVFGVYLILLQSGIVRPTSSTLRIYTCLRNVFHASDNDGDDNTYGDNDSSYSTTGNETKTQRTNAEYSGLDTTNSSFDFDADFGSNNGHEQTNGFGGGINGAVSGTPRIVGEGAPHPMAQDAIPVSMGGRHLFDTGSGVVHNSAYHRLATESPFVDRNGTKAPGDQRGRSDENMLSDGVVEGVTKVIELSSTTVRNISPSNGGATGGDHELRQQNGRGSRREIFLDRHDSTQHNTCSDLSFGDASDPVGGRHPTSRGSRSNSVCSSTTGGSSLGRFEVESLEEEVMLSHAFRQESNMVAMPNLKSNSRVAVPVGCTSTTIISNNRSQQQALVHQGVATTTTNGQETECEQHFNQDATPKIKNNTTCHNKTDGDGPGTINGSIRLPVL